MKPPWVPPRGICELRISEVPLSDCCTTDGSCHSAAKTRTTYKVGGVGSAHCQGVVAKAVGDVDEVTAVEVEIGTGLVTVTTATDLGDTLDALVAEAVDEAGYDFAGRVTPAAPA
ncbi:heavy-metal-associated domain-containing protein [Streptomyces carpinensis]|uniref:Heavy-metal-associated domain-containing protein n=2 Tax=Streptomyces carpinensis TaxID=66369 RepID=A0ABV1W735_9ACTN|nr:heavy-metal-associated domain-containing protein [Streptomyces carpinensis]